MLARGFKSGLDLKHGIDEKRAEIRTRFDYIVEFFEERNNIEY